MFEYAFMRRAFAVGLLLGVIMPCIGVMIVLKRLSMLGDALSHTSLAGVAAGLLLDIDPVLGATAACVAAAFGIEVIRKKIPQYAELSIAVMLSACGVCHAGCPQLPPDRVVQHPVCRGLYRRRADAGFLCRAEAGRYDRAAGCWLSACDSCGQNSGGALFPQKA